MTECKKTVYYQLKEDNGTGYNSENEENNTLLLLSKNKTKHTCRLSKTAATLFKPGENITKMQVTICSHCKTAVILLV